MQHSDLLMDYLGSKFINIAYQVLSKLYQNFIINF